MPEKNYPITVCVQHVSFLDTQEHSNKDKFEGCLYFHFESVAAAKNRFPILIDAKYLTPLSPFRRIIKKETSKFGNMIVTTFKKYYIYES